MKANILVGALVVITAVLVSGYEYHRITSIIHIHLPVFLKNETNAIATQLGDSLKKTDDVSTNEIPLVIFPSVSVRIEMKHSKKVRVISATNSHLAPPQWFIDLLMQAPIEYQMSFYEQSEKHATIYTTMVPNALLREVWISFIIGLTFFLIMYIALTRLMTAK